MLQRLVYGITLLLLIAGGDAAKFGMTNSHFVGVTAGSSFNINWVDASGSVTVLLKSGEANALKTAFTIATGLTGSSFVWSIPSTLPTDYYAFEIDDNSGINYSVRFQITGEAVTSSSVTSTLSTSTAVVTIKTSSSSSLRPTPSPTPTLTTTTSLTTSSSPSSSPTSFTSSSSSSINSQSSSSSSTSTSTSTSSSGTTTPLPASSTNNGLSSGTKAAIGTGVSLGVIVIAGIGFFLFWFGKRSATRKAKGDTSTNVLDKAELGPGIPLNEEEKAELERRRRAAELDGTDAIIPVEMGAGAKKSERAELEARRKATKEMYEMS